MENVRTLLRTMHLEKIVLISSLYSRFLLIYPTFPLMSWYKFCSSNSFDPVLSQSLREDVTYFTIFEVQGYYRLFSFFCLLLSSAFAITSSQILQLIELPTSLNHYLLPQLPSLWCWAEACWEQESHWEENMVKEYLPETMKSKGHFSLAEFFPLLQFN